MCLMTPYLDTASFIPPLPHRTRIPWCVAPCLAAERTARACSGPWVGRQDISAAYLRRSVLPALPPANAVLPVDRSTDRVLPGAAGAPSPEPPRRTARDHRASPQQ